MAQPAGGRAPVVRADAGHCRVDRGGCRGGPAGARAAAGGDRGAADGRHEPCRRPVRRGQDVPAAGGQKRARHETRRRLAHPLPGSREGGRGLLLGRQGAARHRQGRRPRYRQEHRRRRAPVQQLRDRRPRRDDALSPHPGDGEARAGGHYRALRPDYAEPRRDVLRRRRDGARGLRTAAADRRGDDQQGAHGRAHRAQL